MYVGVRSLITAAGRFERMRIGDRRVILETVCHWLRDWPERFFVAAGSAGLTQKSFQTTL